MVIIKMKKFLREFVETDFGLLEELRSSDCLVQDECDEIAAGESSCKRADLLLNYVLNMSPKQYDKFLSALRHTFQLHIACYIESNGGILC